MKPFMSIGRMSVSAVVLSAAVLVLSACGGGTSGPQVASLGNGNGAAADSGTGASPSPSGSVDREAAARAFSSCMRANGVPSFPDPTVDSNGNVQMGFGQGAGIDRNDPNVRKAFTACRSKIQGLRQNFSPEQQQQMQDALLKYAQCMRTNGYQMADPDFSGGAGGGFRALGDVNRQDPAFKAADTICRPLTLGKLGFGPGGFGGGGNGPGGNGGAGNGPGGSPSALPTPGASA